MVFFSDNIDAFKKIWREYYEWTSKKDPSGKDKTRRMAGKPAYDWHMNKLQELYEKHIISTGIMKDDKPKSTYIPSVLKEQAWKEANGICPICKIAFTPEDEIQYDHYIAASISSDPLKIYAMHRKCNRQKSDHTQQTAQQLNDFMKQAV